MILYLLGENMKFEFRQLSLKNGIDEYNMLQDIGGNEYGFTNEVNGMSYEEYKEWLKRENDFSQAKNLPENWIPQTTYFLYAGGNPVGLARIRHCSSDVLENQGVGNFGYGIAKAHRGKGYGTVLLSFILEKCKAFGYAKIKSFVHVDNVASNKIFLKNGSSLSGSFNGIKNIYETIIG